jgi:isoamylase
MSMLQTHPSLQLTHPLPYGAILHDGGVEFIVFSRSATSMRLLLYKHVDDREPSDTIVFDRESGRWGDIWNIFVPGLSAGQLYHFQADGPFDPERGQRFDGRARLIDPYARALAGDFLPATDGQIRPPKCVVVNDQFDWQHDRRPRRSLAESVIYELHVKGFTRDPSSKVKNPGTYLGIIEKIPYLKSLGVTAVELMPVHEFPIKTPWGEVDSRPNYWGYHPLAFFAPHRGYACGSEPGAQVNEFKQMVRELHRAGIEVILDVVFNHTAEGNELGPTLSLKGLENNIYYMMGNGGSYYRNFTGCGNTINGNHPVVREMIFRCLRHWVHNYHVDGFRFDLASILSRDRNGDLLPNPPMVELIAEDPLLADTKIIAEAWDAAGAYQVGSFATQRWAEWNGRFRDDTRRFWRGDWNLTGALATRLAGSSDLYEANGRHPYHSINFVTSHDGFTLNDLVSYNEKHNESNGEGNRDGDNNNCSYNYGTEGPTYRRNIENVRRRQIKNLLATLLLSQGVPMLLAGDECRRTQHGNNNAFCQDNPVSWFDWKLVEQNVDLVRFTQALIAFRKANPTIRQATFLSGLANSAGMFPQVGWFASNGEAKDWNQGHQHLACLLGATPQTKWDATGMHMLMFFNSGHDAHDFHVPELALHLTWKRFIDTAAACPDDIFPCLDGPVLSHPPIARVEGRSLLVFVAEAHSHGQFAAN